METEIDWDSDEVYNGIMKNLETNHVPKVSSEHPLMICCNKKCNAKYTLPIPYEECSPMFRDYCPSCVISIYEEELNRQEYNDNRGDYEYDETRR